MEKLLEHLTYEELESLRIELQKRRTRIKRALKYGSPFAIYARELGQIQEDLEEIEVLRMFKRPQRENA